MTLRRLEGRRIVLTRPSGKEDAAEALLVAEGALVTHVPLLKIMEPSDKGQALREALDVSGPRGWIALSSASAVPSLLAAAGTAEALAHKRFAVVGEATKNALESAGLSAAIVGDGSGGAGLAACIGQPEEPGELIVLAVAQEARPELPTGLRQAGWEVREVPAYSTEPTQLTAVRAVALAAADVVVVTSPKAAQALAGHLGQRLRGRLVVAIGPTTAEGAATAGFSNLVVADAPSPEGVLRAVLKACGVTTPDA